MFDISCVCVDETSTSSSFCSSTGPQLLIVHFWSSPALPAYPVFLPPIIHSLLLLSHILPGSVRGHQKIAGHTHIDSATHSCPGLIKLRRTFGLTWADVTYLLPLTLNKEIFSWSCCCTLPVVNIGFITLQANWTITWKLLSAVSMWWSRSCPVVAGNEACSTWSWWLQEKELREERLSERKSGWKGLFCPPSPLTQHTQHLGPFSQK